MKRKICFFTGTRADYGIMSRLLRRLSADRETELQIVATNMHLSPEYGMTANEIESDGLRIDRKVEMLLSSDSAVGTVKSMGLASIGFADALDQLKPDMTLILGDRYEMLAAASASLIFGIPIAHFYGGEITEGAYDDAIRNSITQMATWHFTSTEAYRRRIISMGKPAENVWHIGSLGVDNLLSESPMPLEQLEESLQFRLGSKFILVTFHPATMQSGMAETHTRALLNALTTLPDDYRILFTMPNSDTDGRIVASMIRDWCEDRKEKAFAITSLGRKRYHSALAHCRAVVGNSSSGLIEAPSFRIPTLDIGDRQKGRAAGNTVVHTEADTDSIISGLKRVISDEFCDFTAGCAQNPYYLGNTLDKACEIIRSLSF